MSAEMKKTKKIGIIAACVAILMLIAGVLVFFLLRKEEGYRVIQIYEIEGEATLERKNVGETEAYENLMLQKEDILRTNAESSLRLKMDENKFMLMEQETEIQLFASGDSKDSKTDIRLNYGAVTVDIREKLSEKSSYKITTPNSVMAVRGTVFTVRVFRDENRKWVTEILALEGKVSVSKIDEDGVISEEVMVESGKQAIIREEKEELQIILLDEPDYEMLSLEALEFLKEAAENGRTLSISIDEIEEMIKSFKEDTKTEPEQEEEDREYIVEFRFNGQVFGKQTVEAGGYAQIPALTPDEEGAWDFDFSRPITEDTVIEYR